MWVYSDTQSNEQSKILINSHVVSWETTNICITSGYLPRTSIVHHYCSTTHIVSHFNIPLMRKKVEIITLVQFVKPAILNCSREKFTGNTVLRRDTWHSTYINII